MKFPFWRWFFRFSILLFHSRTYWKYRKLFQWNIPHTVKWRRDFYRSFFSEKRIRTICQSNEIQNPTVQTLYRRHFTNYERMLFRRRNNPYERQVNPHMRFNHLKKIIYNNLSQIYHFIQLSKIFKLLIKKSPRYWQII